MKKIKLIKNKKPNIAFFGTSDRSIPILEALENSKYNLALCVTKADVKVGRKREVKPTAVKSWAESNRVQFITIENLRGVSTENVFKGLKDFEIDLIIVADFSFMIPEKIFEFPEYKTINIHFSLLPHYRGAAPVQFAILNGDKKTGITYQLMKKEMDVGEIVHQLEHALNGTETSEELYKTLFEKAAAELPCVIKKYVNKKYKPFEQNHELATYTRSPSHPKHTFVFKEDAKIDWKKSPKEIEQAVRAYTPWPVAWTRLGSLCKHLGIKCKKDPTLMIKIISSKLDGDSLKINKVKVAGKNEMDWDSFKNGYLK